MSNQATVKPKTAEGSGEIMRGKTTTSEVSLERYNHYSNYSYAEHKKKMTDLFPKASKRLSQFETLESNWDGEEASPPSVETLNHAYEVLGALWQSACTKRLRPPEPRVTCDANGDITFAWTIGKKDIELGFSMIKGVPRYEYLICLTSDEPICEEGPYEGELANSPMFGALLSGF